MCTNIVINSSLIEYLSTVISEPFLLLLLLFYAVFSVFFERRQTGHRIREREKTCGPTPPPHPHQ